MKVVVASLLCLLGELQAFAPHSFVGIPNRRSRISSSSARSFGIDPSFFHDIPQQMGAMQDMFTSLTISADGLDAVSGAVSDVAASSDASAAADAANNNGWFGFLTGPIEGLLQLIHVGLVGVGLSADAWGVSIIALTVLIKILTYPLTKTQLESTTKMQAMQPAIKELQTKYQSNPDVMNQKVAEFYQANNINPLAGCFPSLVQIPVFIGLYRAVLTLAKDNKLDEPFLWLPNLEGPTYGADPAHGSDWILTGWTDGVPSLGWENTIAFLVLPVFLVVSQFASMQLMQPQDNSQQQGNFVLKLLPLMIGWFSLNVPAALCLYWVVNNIITTATSLFIRNTLKVDAVITPGGAAAARAEPPKTIFAPPREKPAGFGVPVTPTVSSENVKPITAMDAEIVEVDEDEEDDVEVEQDSDVSPTASSGTGMGSDTQPTKKKRGGKKRRKKT